MSPCRNSVPTSQVALGLRALLTAPDECLNVSRFPGRTTKLCLAVYQSSECYWHQSKHFSESRDQLASRAISATLSQDCALNHVTLLQIRSSHSQCTQSENIAACYGSHLYCG